jgi:hypothetical protein
MTKLVRWLWVLVLMAGLYSGWVTAEGANHKTASETLEGVVR